MNNHQRNLYIEDCKEEFREFVVLHKFLMRHVRRYKIIRHNEIELIIPEKILGTVIVFYECDTLRVGFSRLHEGDKYNRHIGIIKAINDALSDKPRKYQDNLTK